MRQLIETADTVTDKILATSRFRKSVDVVACSEVIKAFVKLLMNKGIRLIGCTIADDDDWYIINIKDGEMDVVELSSVVAGDTAFFQYDVDEQIVTSCESDIILFELKQGMP